MFIVHVYDERVSEVKGDHDREDDHDRWKINFRTSALSVLWCGCSGWFRAAALLLISGLRARPLYNSSAIYILGFFST